MDIGEISEISELRKQIDAIDRELVELYRRRMETVGAIGQYKREHGLPVLDSGREKSLLDKVAKQAGEAYEEGIRELYQLLLEQSRRHQERDGGAEG